MLRQRFTNHLKIIYPVTFVVVLPLLCYNLPQSVYHRWLTSTDQTEKQLQLDNHLRISEARQILEDLTNSRTGQWMHAPNTTVARVTIAMTVMTVSRNDIVKSDTYSPQYLTQVIANLMKLIHAHRLHDNRLFVNLSICNGDEKPNDHVEAVHLSKYVPMFVKPVDLGEKLVNKKERMKRGYVYCLKELYSLNTDFVYVIEDDAIPHSDMMPVLDHVIQGYLEPVNHRQDMFLTHKTRHPPAFIKFYHPERLIGFVALDPERIPELFSFGIVLSSLLTIIYCICTAQNRDALHSHDNKVAWIWCRFFLYGVLVCLCIGRSNLISFHRLVSPHLYYLTKSPSCCTQAVMYPRQHLASLISHFEGVTCNDKYASDHALDDFIYQTGLDSYLVQPNSFTNIGLYSALRRAKINPYSVV